MYHVAVFMLHVPIEESFLLLSSIPEYACTTGFNHSLPEEHQGSLQVFTVNTKGVINISYSFQRERVLFSLGKHPRVQFLCNMVATLFSLLDTATVFRVVVPFYILTAMYESFIFPAFLAFGTVIIFLF